MKHLRLILGTIAVVGVGGWAVAFACDTKTTKTTNASAAAMHHGACPYASAAECKAHGMDASACAGKTSATAAAYDHCSGKAGVSAAAAGHEACAGKTSATTAAYDHCSGKAGVSAAAAGHEACAGKTTAAAAGHMSCAGKAAAFPTAGRASDHCGAKGASMASGTCRGQGMSQAADASTHADCDACVDMAACEEEIEGLGASTQVVPLKNGVMFVYTTSNPSKVRAVQAALVRRNERMAAMTTSGDKAHLCSACKEMRGAAASGKLTREVVNIEGGCLTLMTSTDPSIVSKIRSMAGMAVAARTKS